MNPDASNPFGDTTALPASLGSLQAAKRPGVLTAVCIISIILGSLGALSSVMQLANLVGGRQMQRAFAGAGQFGSPEEMRGVQDEFNEAVAVVADKYFWANVATAVAHMIVAALLIYGGASTLRLSFRGYRVLMVTALVAIVFEIARAIPYLMIQLDLLPVLEEYMPRIMQSASASGDEALEAGATFGAVVARVTAVLGIVFFCGWCLVKVVFYGITNRYLKKANVRRLFVTEPVEMP